jgi:membrane protein
LTTVKSSKLSVSLAKEALAVRKQTARGWLRRTSAGRTMARIIKGIIDIELADRSMTLAAQEFTSVLPVIIAVGTIGNLNSAGSTIFEQVGIDPSEFDLSPVTATALESNTPTFATFGVIGILMVILSGTSFARALGRLYGKVWNIPTLSIRGGWRWVAVLFAVASAVSLLGAARNVNGLQWWVGLPLEFGIELVVWFALWAAVPYLLTEGRLAGRVLWATAAATSFGLAVLAIAGKIYLPFAGASAQDKFGALGLVFTSITWMFVMSGVVVAAATTVKALALDEGWVGRALRGPSPLLEPAKDTSIAEAV